jgi:hypothetical protein
MRTRIVPATILLLLATILLAAGCTSTHPPALADANVTPAAAVTTAGTCIDNLTLCSGFCRDLRTDKANCGMCGIACPPEHTCAGGICKATDVCPGGICPVPTPKAGGTAAAAATGTVPAATGTVPAATTLIPKTTMTVTATTTTIVLVPVTGTTVAAVPICPSGKTSCSGKCVDLLTDPSNCGFCGQDCNLPYGGAGHLCHAGVCDPCPYDSLFCDGKCVEISQNNCGACGHACGAGQTCQFSPYPGSCYPPVTPTITITTGVTNSKVGGIL